MMILLRARWLAWACRMVVGLSVLVACGGSDAQLAGTDLGATASPGFALTDQRGNAVSLTDLRGRAVALTFIYTNCADVCPLIAEKYRAAYAQLPDEARAKVALVAITVDPERDTREALRAFSARHGLADNPAWFALTGERPALAQVWRAYGIEPGDFMHEADHQGGHASMPADAHGGAAASPEMLSHTDAIYFIDPFGKERALLRADASPTAIADNLRQLAE